MRRSELARGVEPERSVTHDLAQSCPTAESSPALSQSMSSSERLAATRRFASQSRRREIERMSVRASSPKRRPSCDPPFHKLCQSPAGTSGNTGLRPCGVWYSAVLAPALHRSSSRSITPRPGECCSRRNTIQMVSSRRARHSNKRSPSASAEWDVLGPLLAAVVLVPPGGRSHVEGDSERERAWDGSRGGGRGRERARFREVPTAWWAARVGAIRGGAGGLGR